MRSVRYGLVCSLLVCIASISARPYDAAHEFEGHRFTMQVPESYQLGNEVSPMPGVKNFGFVTEPRSDGTRGIIQVTLIDLKKSGAPAGLTLEKFAASTIESIRSRRMQWMAKESAQRITGVAGRRFDWSGMADLGHGRMTGTMRGVVMVGLKGNVAFALTTQDFTMDALRTCEKAMLSFSLSVKK
jgi:hypothetical protein